jgi:hypothetical protein
MEGEEILLPNHLHFLPYRFANLPSTKGSLNALRLNGNLLASKVTQIQ